MNMTEKTVESKTIFEGKIMTILLDKAELPNGVITGREVCVHPGGVGVLPLDDSSPSRRTPWPTWRTRPRRALRR